MKIMTETTDGFRVSEEDLELRGPGEVLGSMQHGMPLFKAGDLVHDMRLIQESRQAAEEILNADPFLRKPLHTGLRLAIRSLYGRHESLTA
jgi:ATP-dependent DNA helicase RecG